MSEMWTPQNAGNIGGWSPAELRRFVVNTILNDPGALPGAAISAQDISGYPNEDTTTLHGNGAWGPPLSFLRLQAQPSGFIVDANFRIYNWNSPVAVYVNDPTGYFTITGGHVIVNKTCTVAISMPGVSPSQGNFAMGWAPVYNGSGIDVSAGGFYYQATAGVIQQGANTGFTINQLTAGTQIQPGGYCNSGTPTVVLNLIVLRDF